jgi:hypothetical protein
MPKLTHKPARYVVLRHTGVADPHFDFMLEIEANGSLKTWRLKKWPPAWGTGEAQFIDALSDHRNEYLHYEGHLSGNRGKVQRIEGGDCLAAAMGREDPAFHIRFGGGKALLISRTRGKGKYFKVRGPWFAAPQGWPDETTTEQH